MNGWTLKREIDVLSIPSLILSLIAVGGVFFAFFSEPRTEYIDNKWLIIAKHEFDSGEVVVKAAKSNGYLNTNRGNKSDALIWENMDVEVGGCTIILEWKETGVWSGDERNFEFEDVNGEANLPREVKSGEVLAHDTHYHPLNVVAKENSSKHCDESVSSLEWTKFFKLVSENRVISATIYAEFLEENLKEMAKCSFTVYDEDRFFTDPKGAWFEFACD
ncbi:hypothetical protein ACUNV4_17995 [Granulosicoccus sp. 3-233]|uniref:hypothetical protein n=1 Tax=Granulosicoccus sp. 3-233 TaxID=3417969 RepID=UPI003D332A8D